MKRIFSPFEFGKEILDIKACLEISGKYLKVPQKELCHSWKVPNYRCDAKPAILNGTEQVSSYDPFCEVSNLAKGCSKGYIEYHVSQKLFLDMRVLAI